MAQTSGPVTAVREPDPIADPFAPARLTSWGGIFAGSFVAGALQILSFTLAGAIAFAAYQGGGGAPTISRLGAGTIAWVLVTSFVTLFAGGWIAARLAAPRDRLAGALHGLAAWGVVTIFSLLIVGMSMGGMRQGQPAEAARAGAPPEQPLSGWEASGRQSWNGGWDAWSEASGWQQQQQQQGWQQGGLRAEELPAGVQADLRRLLRGAPPERQLADALSRAFAGAPVLSDDREALVEALGAQAELSRDQAARVVDRWITSYERSQGVLAGPGGGLGAHGHAKARAFASWGFTSFFGLLLGGLGAALGGLLPRPGSRRPIA